MVYFRIVVMDRGACYHQWSMRTCVVVAAVALGASACGDNVGGGYAAGARLAPIGYVFEDGTTLAAGDRFHDLARDEDCTIQQWADGQRYCTPASAPFVFADAFCRMPIAQVNPEAPVGYAKIPFVAPDGTSYVSKLHPLGAPIGDVPYYRFLLGDCVGPNVDDAATYVEVTADELDKTDFVQVTRTLDEIDDSLSAVRLTASDGLSLPIGFYDRHDGMDCAARDAPDSDATACAPIHRIAASGVYSDAACTIPSANKGAVDRDPTLQAIAVDADGCKRDFALTQNRLFFPAYFKHPDGTCVASDNGDLLYAAGAALEDRPLTRTRLESTTRFSPIVDGWIPLAIRDAYVHDNFGGFDCKPIDGRCQPDAIGTISLFTDYQCTTPIDIAYVDPPTCGEPAKFATTIEHRVYQIGDVDLQPLFMQTVNPDYPCYPATAITGKEPHLLGDEVHLGTFTEAALR
jgi:hypothetical protein